MNADEQRVIRSLFPEVRRVIEAELPSNWPELSSLVHIYLIDHPMPPPVIIPLASCAAAGGRPERAIRTAAAWALLLLSLRWIDDVQDQDRPDGLWTETGVPRAINFGVAAFSLSWKVLTSSKNERVPNEILELFSEAELNLAAGQDWDLNGNITSMNDCMEIMRQKCGTYFALAGRAGAMHSTKNTNIIEACGNYGIHIGTAIQILDDLEGIFFPNGKGDLAQGKVTLPLLYGMMVRHPKRDILRKWIETGNYLDNTENIRELLNDIETRSFLLWTALQEREQALKPLKICPGALGVQTLEFFANSLFAHFEDILK